VNSEELGVLDRLFGWRYTTETDMLKATFDWPSQSGVAILTRGEAGCLVYHQWEEDDGEGGEYFPSELLEESAVPARVVDTVGAGDAFTAAMVCLHLEGRPLRDCARFANHYAARVCEHQGATPRIDRAEVERAAFG
jgi:fructokinase